jgi:hypothetical protein
MADRKFTLLELHTHDGIQVGPTGLGDADETDDERSASAPSDVDDTDVETADGGGSTARRVLGAVAAVGVVVLLARTARRLLLGDAEDVDLDLDADDEDLVEADLSDD